MPRDRASVPPNPNGNLWDLAAIVLGLFRREQGESLAGVGRVLNIGRSTVARYESGEVRLGAVHAATLDTEWALRGFLSGLISQAQGRHDGNWTAERGELIRSAARLLIWELAWIPGPFQTDAYARAAFERAGVSEADMEAALGRRLSERNLNPQVEIRCLLDQGVIEQPVGGRDVMRAQLEHLLDLSAKTSIRIIPRSVGAHPGRDGSWWVMSGKKGDAAYTETMGPGRLIRDASEVESYRVWFDRIADFALSRPESQHAIQQAMEGFS